MVVPFQKLTTNRVVFVTILWRLEGEPSAADAGFGDAESGSYYENTVNWASAMGIVSGMSASANDRFGCEVR